MPPVANYYDTIADRRVVSNVEPGYLKKLLPVGPPQDGEPWAQIQKDIESKIMPGLTHWYILPSTVLNLADKWQAITQLYGLLSCLLFLSWYAW